MKKYKININRPKISKEEIRSHQDFGKVLRNYSKFTKPLYNYPKFLNGLVAVAAIGVVVYYTRLQEDNSQKEKPASENVTPANNLLNISDTVNTIKDKVIEKSKDTVQGKKVTFHAKSNITTSISKKLSNTTIQQKISHRKSENLEHVDIDTIDVQDPKTFQWSKKIIYHPK